jgi:hypothetical protein
MKTWITAAVIAAIACTFGLVGAAFGAAPGGSRISCLDWVSRSAATSTSSTAWRGVPGMTLRELDALNDGVQLSASFSGAPVALRMRDASVGGTLTMPPGLARFTPGATARAGVSFTWVGSSPAEHQHTFALQWRLVSPGGTATMRAGAMTATYLGAPTAGSCRGPA